MDFDGTQEVLPCSSRFLRALQQNRAQSRLLCLFKYNATQACSMEKLTDLYNLLTFEYITLLVCLKESYVNYNDSRES